MHVLDRSDRRASTLAVALVLLIASTADVSIAAATRSIPIGVAGMALGLLSAVALVCTFAFAAPSLRWLLTTLAVASPLGGAPWAMYGPHLLDVGMALGRATGTDGVLVTDVVESTSFVLVLVSLSAVMILAVVIPVRLAMFGRQVWAAADDAPWRRTSSATVLWIAARLCLPAGMAPVKFEEWCAELAAIESRWQRAVHLVDLLCDMHRSARAARTRGPGGPP